MDFYTVTTELNETIPPFNCDLCNRQENDKISDSKFKYKKVENSTTE